MLMGIRVGNGGIERLMRYYDISVDEYSRLNTTPIERVREGMIVLVEILEDIEHVVHPFESVESIARTYGVTPDAIRARNHIDSVFLGDRVYIPRQKSKK